MPEGLVAKAATERPYILVHSHMYHQVIGLGKGFPTHLAILKDPVAGLVVADGLVDVGKVVGLDFVKASVVVADLGHHRTSGSGLNGLGRGAGAGLSGLGLERISCCQI